ncbi:porin [Pseudoduganella rivuli]|nr:porin [Pseudoduganella rivuli]
MNKNAMGSVIAVAAALSTQHASAVDFKAGDWTVGVGGIVNAYYTQVSCTGTAVGGLALADRGLGCGGKKDRSTVGNGLLPNGLVASAGSNLGGYDVKAVVAIYSATATDSAVAQNSTVDVRQAYFTFGNNDMGTVKLGRDLGIFGSNAILGDMTLLGAGLPVQATQRGRVTLGHIGAGYSYMGYYGQIAYSAPKSAGIGIDVALVSPVADTPVIAASKYSAGTAPQVQAQLSWSGSGAKVWLGAKTQKFEALAAGSRDLTMSALELGVSYADGPFGMLANVQGGKAIGILSDADQGDVRGRNYFVQGTYKATDKMKLGLGYGVSRNSDNAVGTGGLKQNANLTLGAYYSLNSAITLVGEVGQSRSKAFSGGEAKMNGASLGGIIFF